MKEINGIKSKYLSDVLYKNLLHRRYGIGHTKITYKDYILSKLFTEYCYTETIDMATCKKTGNTKSKYYNFVGIVTQDYVLTDNIGYFDNDDHAGQFGVPVEGIYYLSKSNTYGLPFGMVKRRAEPIDPITDYE